MEKSITVALAPLLLGNVSEESLLSLPKQLLTLRRLCQREDTDIYDVEMAVAKEPAFCAYLIQLANSALYGAGKEVCQNLFCAIRRLGIHSVSQYALTFALKKRHDLQGAPAEIIALLKENWQDSWALSQQAIALYWRHRHCGDEMAKGIDISDIIVAGALLHTGRLAVFTCLAKLYQSGQDCPAELIRQEADNHNLQLLPALLKFWGLPDLLAKQLMVKNWQGREQLAAVDYLYGAGLLGLFEAQSADCKPCYHFLTAALDSEQLPLFADYLIEKQIILPQELAFR